MKIKVFLSLLFIGFGILFCVILLINHLQQKVTDRQQKIDKILSRNEDPSPRIPRTVEIPDDIRQKFATVPEKPTLIAEFVQSGYFQSVKFSPTNHNLVLSMARGNNENNIKLWNINNPTTPLAEFSGYSVSFSPNGKILAISDYRGIEDGVKFWDIAEEKFISSISVPVYHNIAFSPNGKHLAVETLGLELWDVSNLTKPVEVIRQNGENIEYDHTFSADGKLMATIDSRNDIVNIWEIDGNQVIKRESIDVTNKKYGRIEAMKFSPNIQNPILAIAGNDEDIRLYHPPDWQNYTVIPAGNVYDLVFTSDGSTIISGGTKELKFWSTDNGNCYASLEGYSDWVKCVDVSADSRYVVGSGNDGIIRVWDITHFLPSRQSNIPNVVVPIYFLPTNRLPQIDISEKIDKILKEVQTFFADEMERHGYGRKSFEFEKNKNGSAKVYLFEGNTADEYYHKSTNSRVMKEIKQHFETYNKFFFIVVDKSKKKKFSADDDENIPTVADIKRRMSTYIKDSSDVRRHINILLQNIVFREQGGEIILKNSLDRYSKDAITYKFAHSFGLNRDYRSPSFLMSYNEQSKHLSKSSAAWLNKCQFFNSVNTYFDDKTVIGKFSRSRGKARFKVEDADGIYQVRLLVEPTNENPPPNFQWKEDSAENKTEWEQNFKGRSNVLHDVLTLNCEKMATVKLDYPKFSNNWIKIQVIDKLGNRVYMIVGIRGNPLEYFLQSILD
ncbi:hypothetical protein C6497_05210 [Candidatus Poribacteria bacterium]|nr:MAG: hypothetical protein C6497_05210 [Candidatus Poribacteria bacterium]